MDEKHATVRLADAIKFLSGEYTSNGQGNRSAQLVSMYGVLHT
jgi:hypothetical protein